MPQTYPYPARSGDHALVDSLDDIFEAISVSEEEGEILGDLECEQVIRIMHKAALEVARSSLPLSIGPGPGREEMEVLAFSAPDGPRVEVGHKRPRFFKTCCRRRIQRQIHLKRPSQEEFGVEGGNLLCGGTGITSHGDQLFDCLVEEVDRDLVAGKDGAPPAVVERTTHCFPPSLGSLTARTHLERHPCRRLRTSCLSGCHTACDVP